MVQNEELRIVRGNAFNVKIQVEAIRLDGTKVDNFNLAEANAQLKVWHAGQKTAKEFVIDGNSAIISFADTELLGWYGLEMSGTFESAPWRFAVTQVFQIVETNEKANVPAWTFLTDDTYFVEGVLTLYANGATHQADWDETNPTSPSYIKNKPAVVSPTQLQQAINTEKERAEAAEQANADAIAEKYTKPSGGIPSTDMTEAVQTSLQKAENAAPQATTYTKEQVDAMIADFITRSVNDLMNYYLKSETYTKAEVQQLINAVKQFTYDVVNTLPTASEETMHKIYLVPSTNPQTQNVKDEYITIIDGSAYKWEQIGSTTVDLSGYYTSAQTDQAISNALTNALSNYSTTTQMNTAITTALNNALAAYSTTQQMNAAIAAALAPYYTKTEIDTMLESKADTDGNYPQLVAGNVVGEFNQEAEVSFRPSAGTIDIQSGYKVNYGGHLEGVKGNAVYWNQIFDAATWTNGGSDGSITQGGNLFTYTVATIGTNAWDNRFLIYKANAFSSSHKYLVVFKVKAPTANAISLSGNGLSGNVSVGSPVANQWTQMAAILDGARIYASNQIWFCLNCVSGYSVGDSIQIKDINIFDISLIYSIGNEPTNVADFEADYLKWFGKPLGYEPYNAGELIPVKMAGLKTVGFNQYNGHPLTLVPGKVYQITGTYTSIAIDGETITPDSNGKFTATNGGTLTVTGGGADTCVHFVHSGARDGQYEPYWSSLLPFDVTNVYGKVNGEGSLVQIAANGLKKADYAGTIYDVINLKDCTADIRVSDTPATPGEGLYEPLATPLHYTDLVYRINGVDYPLEGALPYKVDDYGTEEVVAISGEKTVAPVLQLRYGINVGDTTKNLPFNYLSPKMQQTFTEDEKRQARKNIGVDATSADVLALIRANEDALLTAMKTAGIITDYTLDAEADANGVYGVTVS